jgi:hypothetical protein
MFNQPFLDDTENTPTVADVAEDFMDTLTGAAYQKGAGNPLTKAPVDNPLKGFKSRQAPRMDTSKLVDELGRNVENEINYEVNQEEVRKITQEAIRQKRTKNCKEVLQDLVNEYLRRGQQVSIHFNDQAHIAQITFNATPFMLSYLTEDLESYLIGVRNIFDSELRKKAENATQTAASMNDVDAKVKSEVAREVARIMAEMATTGAY